MDNDKKKKIEALEATRQRIIDSMKEEVSNCEFALSRWLRKLHETIEEMEEIYKEVGKNELLGSR